MDKRKRITVTFGEYDDDVYNFLKSNKNASALVRHLVRLYIKNVPIEPIPTCEMSKNEPIEEKIEEKVEEKVEEKPFAKAAELDLEKARELAVDFVL